MTLLADAADTRLSGQGTGPIPTAIPTSYDYAFLYPWQQEALKSWHHNARRGVVEAVTGSGKTRVGVAAAFEAVRQGIKVLILVPTAELQRQWLESLKRDLPKATRGALGGGRTDTLDNVDILVAIVHSASNRQTLRSHKAGLIIADECHRYAAPMFAGALQEQYAWRLGLTATYERGDGEHDNALTPYFGGVIYTLWYDRALKDQVIAPFDIALVGVELTDGEQVHYADYSEVLLETGRNLENYAGIPRRPFAHFIAAVSALAGSDSASREAMLARKYVRAMASRLTLLADAKKKYHALAALKATVDGSRGTLVFTQTQDSARRTEDLYTAMGSRASAIFSGMTQEDRKQGMDDFRSGASQILAAPRLLDEGIDVPEADLGIIVAANRSQRQMVQRLGRVIRKKNDGRVGRLVVLYSKGTVEDPDVQGEEFLARVLPFARHVEFFDIEQDLTGIEEYLRYSELPVKPVVPNAPESPDHPSDRDVEETQHDVPDETAPSTFDWDDEEEWEEQLAGFEGLTDDAVRDYLRRIGRHELLTAEQEVELAQDIEAGLFAQHLLDDGEDRSRRETRELTVIAYRGQKAKDALLNSNLRLVVSLAKRYTNRGLDFLDVIQEGNLGLHRAVQKFDYAQGFKFSTYATWWIRQAITRGLADQARLIRFPVHLVEQINVVRRHQREIEAMRSAVATIQEIATASDSTPQKVEELLKLDRPLVSLDRQISDGRGGTEALAEQLYDPAEPSPMDKATMSLLQRHLHVLLDPLTEREAGVIAMRFGLADGQQRTLDAIGEVYGVTRERIRQIEKQTMDKLRSPEIMGSLIGF
ncbi:sigma-70 family RNA polymerase sigma factor [Arthrobacter sp. EH-1B-1]|uniref:Sigma-70 family RNA polymerase sigma factor n=1 Tax=Arthrobacter vasquezii TaxID=2977629 RepID=A0ABT6CR13_9MICC|nr:sigma-70 family RNA polymerase sigma factor [Arthrobacter vasquezii]MDF9276256.1 sigma-70 family RNA polymerase sigma factor [Arthrobacter vasquezii]